MDEGPQHQQVDAAMFLAVTDALHAALARLDAAGLSADRRTRWQRRLAAISTLAQRDLARARDQLARLDADWRREVGP